MAYEFINAYLSTVDASMRVKKIQTAALAIKEKQAIKDFIIPFLNTDQQVNVIYGLYYLENPTNSCILNVYSSGDEISGILFNRGEFYFFIGNNETLSEAATKINNVLSYITRFTEAQLFSCKQQLQFTSKLALDYCQLQTTLTTEKATRVVFATNDDVEHLEVFYDKTIKNKTELFENNLWPIIREQGHIVSSAYLNAICEVNKQRYAIIGGVKTAFGYLNRGYATAILRSLINSLHTLSYNQIFLEVATGNAPAHKVYEKVGFQPIMKLILVERGSDSLQKITDEITEASLWYKV